LFRLHETGHHKEHMVAQWMRNTEQKVLCKKAFIN